MNEWRLGKILVIEWLKLLITSLIGIVLPLSPYLAIFLGDKAVQKLN